MSRAVRRTLIGVLIFFLILSVVLVILIPYIFIRPFPHISGTVNLPGLEKPVDVYRDSFGIPHIYADNPHDLFFVQGYVHAQDRFWQMDVWRHFGSGRLAEMFGEGRIEIDTILRTLGFARVVQAELDAIDPATLAVLQAYADGVNAYLVDHKGADLSLEYVILGLMNPDYQPEPWQPLHTLTWARVMAFDLGGDMDAEIEMATLLKTLTSEQIAEIVPPYPSDKLIIVPDFQVSDSSVSQTAAMVAGSRFLTSISPVLGDLKGQIDLLDKILGPRGFGIGSNSWVVSGELTNTRMPLLANDPHLSAQMPAIWYEVGLHCTQKDENCPYDVTGFSFAGAPGIIIGHNDRIAWGLTNAGPDVQDLYIEKINPKNPTQYEVNGTWQDMQLVTETIQVAGGKPVELTVRYTRHGPVLSDTTYLPEDFGENVGVDLPQPYTIALRWTALEPNPIYNAILQFNRATNWEEFREGARDFAAPSQNLLYADVDGNIGYQMPGNIPLRAKGDGSLPVPGWTDDYEWIGYIPFDELPFTLNPPQGYIVAANNAAVSTDYPYLITTVFDHGYRAQRIVDMIENAPSPIDMEYMQKIQGDDMDLNAELLVPLMMQIPVGVGNEDARQLLEGWDYQTNMDSPAAALFEAFWVKLLSATFHDDLPEDSWPAGSSRWFAVIANLIEQPNSPWWDIRTTTPVETRDVIFSAAFTAAVNDLEAILGPDPSQWTWGNLHTLTLENQTLGNSDIPPIEALFNRGPYRTSGGSGIVNATGWDAAGDPPYIVKGLPSMRMIVDLSNLSNSLAIHTTGQSGHASHLHYADMTDMWRNIQYHPMLWDRQQIEGDAEGHLHLVP